MATYFNTTGGGSVSVTDGTDTLSISAAGLPNGLVDETLVLRTNTSLTGTTTMYTVPAGKTLYLYAVSIAGNIPDGWNADASIKVRTDADGTTREISGIAFKNSTTGSGFSQVSNWQPAAPLKIPEGKIVDVIVDQLYHQVTTIYGYLK